MEPSGIEAYRLGRSYEVLPIPMVPEHCVEVPAGPLVLVVEGRRLTDEAITANAVAQGRPDAVEGPVGVQDGGASVHVLGPDGLEHLRFDCFEHEPHYHYVDNEAGANVVVRLDTFAEGDPVAWTLERLRHRLPEMLEHSGAAALASEVRARGDEVTAALPEVERLVALAAAPPPDLWLDAGRGSAGNRARAGWRPAAGGTPTGGAVDSPAGPARSGPHSPGGLPWAASTARS